ncbi:MAG: V-type ATP synthase subunit C [Deltaproteobacteria bacterium]|nr:V-type ATP synthase subunit C [Deltaproteobacteria bacterium]MBW2121797.1 V-type ATP synthase subunit C [Deltaproteobacteria bacterium]
MEEVRWKYGDDVRYAYAVGVIRVLETRSLSRERIERAAEASSPQDVLRILAETPYSEYLSGLAGPEQYESFLEKEQGKVLNLLQELTKDPVLTDLFFYRFDFHNLKVALKERFGGEELEPAYLSLGRVPVPAIKTAIEEEDLSSLPAWLSTVAEQVVKEFPEREDPKWIDLLIDRRMYEFFVATSRKEGNLFLHGLLQREIDLANILSLFRLRHSKQDRKVFVDSFIEGGTLGRPFFLPLFDEPLEGIPGRFAYTPYRDIVESGWDHLNTDGSFAVFERMGQDEILEYLRRANLIAFGIEPLIAYLYAKETELRMIRTIMVGKLNGLQPSTIKERLPSVHL